MGPRTFRTPTVLALCCLAAATAGAQVFVVGEKTATADVNTQFRIGLLLKAELDQDFDLYIGTRVEDKPNVHFCHAVWHSVSIVA